MNFFINDFGAYLLAFALSFMRTFAALTILPLFVFKQLRAANVLKIAISAGLCVPIFVVTQQEIMLRGQENLTFTPFLIMKEAMIGLMIGYILAVPFWIFRSTGALIDNTRGALSAGYHNPAQGPDAAPLGDLMEKVVVVVLFATGVVPEMFKFIYLSHHYWPALDPFPVLHADSWKIFIEFFNHMTAQFVLYAGPVILVLLLVEAAFAFLGAYSPQLQVYFMAMPGKALAAVFLVTLYFQTLVESIEVEGQYYFDLLNIFKGVFRITDE